jgi:alpha/beta superfamily hydrolase
VTEKKKIMRLPPPEPNAPRSPDTKVRGEEAIVVHGPVDLEARVYAPVGARRAVVIAHPHPLYGGSMHSPVPLAIAKTLADLGGDQVAWLRFDFRGVGGSKGTYDDGKGETDDVVAAIAELRRRAPGAVMSVCGHSFGSWTGLRGAIADGHVERVALVAPSVRFFEFGEAIEAHFKGPLAIILGDEDEFSEVSEARDLAAKLGAEIRVLSGFDHHFMKSRRQMAETVVAFVAPEAREPPLA